ncbi:O-methyltransferase [Colletotrichum musicola]|uniref:O-methyltransferase n=1 Tax=Colletotrichum musicola TaxID=2175873 RepID=A0A8H6KBP0_9PEZI|nr:O-methyltransferase [Colletotrichum musicola]
MTTYSETLSDLATQLSGVAKSPSSDSEKNAAAAAIAKQVLTAVKGPVPDWMDRMLSVSEITAIRLFLDWGAFAVIPENDTVTFAEVADKLNADVSLIRRISWVLVAAGVLRQHGEDRIERTAMARQYLPGTAEGILLQMIFDEHMLPALKLPEYFLQYGRVEPATRLNTPHAFAAGQPEKEIWEIHAQNPKRMKQFMMGMEMVQSYIPVVGIYDFSWVKSKVFPGEDRVLLVDVGGGKGHITKAILKENPFIPAERVALEDRGEVIKEVIALDDPDLRGVRLQVHDFHQPQPIKNALIYCIRRCLHDYGDDVCVTILTQLKMAMAADSKVVISEYVLPNPPSALAAMTDFAMLEIGGKERTAQDWTTLVARAELKIEKIYGLDKEMQAIECVAA